MVEDHSRRGRPTIAVSFECVENASLPLAIFLMCKFEGSSAANTDALVLARVDLATFLIGSVYVAALVEGQRSEGVRALRGSECGDNGHLPVLLSHQLEYLALSTDE